MGVTGSPFCEHKKLRTGCAQCKPATLAIDPTMQAVRYVPQDEREKVAEKRERRASATSAARDVSAPQSADAEAKTLRPTGPGKPLLPQRKKANRNISAAEADAVKPWWVKK